MKGDCKKEEQDLGSTLVPCRCAGERIVYFSEMRLGIALCISVKRMEVAGRSGVQTFCHKSSVLETSRWTEIREVREMEKRPITVQDGRTNNVQDNYNFGVW